MIARTLLREPPAPQQVELVALRLHLAFTDLPFFVALSLLGLLAAAWPTTRRVGGATLWMPGHGGRQHASLFQLSGCAWRR